MLVNNFRAGICDIGGEPITYTETSREMRQRNSETIANFFARYTKALYLERRQTPFSPDEEANAIKDIFSRLQKNGRQ